MSLIKKPMELQSSTVISALIYGQSGMGKTTLACSAPAPVLFDFDGGADRLNEAHQVPTVQVTSFEMAQDAVKEVAADGSYKTIIIDTASKLIDCIIYDVCGDAVPKINQYGIINAKFKAFTHSVTSLGINVVFVAQREIEKDGEVTRYVPQFRASNYKDVICDLNICGYMEVRSVRGKEQRVITFDPTPRSEGKNTGGFEPAYAIPTLTAGMPNDFLTRIFAAYEQRQQSKNEQRAALVAEIGKRAADFENEVATAADADTLNGLLEIAKNTPPMGDLRARMSRALRDRAAVMGLTFNKEGGLYV